jgi:CRISPR-associated endonuclease/helicase Cas3
MTLKFDQFDAFFRELWGHERFPWQRRLAQQVCEGRWPSVIDLPTASGKTACLDIAVFALAVQASRSPEQRTVGRRVFFVVNRRVIVDEANERAVKIATKLKAALEPERGPTILRKVAEALQQISGDAVAPPLDVALLRGGIYRDNRWARSVIQPTIITSTIDQIGSRLLFRGYGVSDAARPLHAALIAHDCTMLLDEAHISQPFVQTLDAICLYRGDGWAAHRIPTPFAVVQMTATPGDSGNDVFRLDDEDRRHPVLGARRNASKPTQLVVAEKARGKNAAVATAALADVLVHHARTLLSDSRRTVAVVVNRIATARAVYDRLRPKDSTSNDERAPQVHLVIGRMRPIDRDALTRAIQARVGSGNRKADTAPMFVVATQCLEVGADFDFDAVVSECASLDALRQRFGRLNRTGRDIRARGAIIMRPDQIRAVAELDSLDENSEPDDPIYGNALARTWNWLTSVATNQTIDVGIVSMELLLDGVDVTPLISPRANAPVILPAYVDAWVQTNPTPSPDPDVSVFLHGPQRGEPDVNICWRADLSEPLREDVWTQIISLCPPSSPECMPVPIGMVRAWLVGQSASDHERSDILDAKTAAEDEVLQSQDHRRIALAWRGPSNSMFVRDPKKDIRPGDTLVLRASAGGWSTFGHIPDAPPDPALTDGRIADEDALAAVDLGEQAYRQSHSRMILRLTLSRIKAWPESESIGALRQWIRNTDRELRLDDLRGLLRQAGEDLRNERPALSDRFRLLAYRSFGLDYERYPDGTGIVLWNRKLIRATGTVAILPAMDDGDDAGSRITREEPISLLDHTTHVRGELDRVLPLLPIARWAAALRTAVDMHDWGKADERFQALLINGDRNDAWAQPTLWAKSARMPTSAAQRRAARRRSGLPDDFRHEMLSLQLAQTAVGYLPEDATQRDLVLHLIAAHHGCARPFAPVVLDDEPPPVSLNLIGLGITLTTDRRKRSQPHRLDSGIAERFGKLSRHLGWWGLAYLEAVLRLSDQRASQREDDADVEPVAECAETR